MIGKEFITAGKALFTVKLNEAFQKKTQKTHFTYLVKANKASQAFDVYVLNGPDNTKHYTKIGQMIQDRGFVASNFSVYAKDDIRVRLFDRVSARLLKDEAEEINKTGFEVKHCNKCARCSRLLTTPISCDLGIGPECIKVIK